MAFLQLGVLALVSLVAMAAPPVVEIPGMGTVQGTDNWRSFWSDRPIYSFMGMAFGQTTGGKFRFKPSERALPWTEPFMADKFGTVCPQVKIPPEGQSAGFWDHVYGLGGEEARGSVDAEDPEDCLKIHVYTPNVDPDAKLPVMVFFHGGAFLDGSAAIYWPQFLLENDVVLVVPHYRLGPLGFLSMDNEDIPGNAGMFDQVLALEWVRDYISVFGGDPTQVTIFGESAGAASVSLLSLSPLSKGLFNRIIAQSGSGIAQWAIDSDPVFNALGVAEYAGCDVTLPEEDIVTCLLTVDPLVLTRAYKWGWKPAQQKEGQTGFGGCTPVVQKAGTRKFLDKMPMEYWNDPEFETVPAIYGANKHEGTYVMAIVYDGFLRANDLLFDHDYIKYNSVTVFLDLFGIKDISYVLHDSLEYEYIGIENVGNLTAMIPGMIDFSGATFLKGPSYENTKLHAKFGKSYWYAFNFGHRSTLWPFVGAFNVPFDGGVSHANDLMFLFNIPAITTLLSPKEKQMAKKMSTVWYNFAAYGEPTPADHMVEGVPEWPHYDPENEFYMRFDEENLKLSNFPEEYTIARDENFPVKPIIP